MSFINKKLKEDSKVKDWKEKGEGEINFYFSQFQIDYVKIIYKILQIYKIFEV